MRDDPHDGFTSRGAPIEPTFSWPEELQIEPPEPWNPRAFAVGVSIVLATLIFIWWL